MLCWKYSPFDPDNPNLASNHFIPVSPLKLYQLVEPSNFIYNNPFNSLITLLTLIILLTRVSHKSISLTVECYYESEPL